MKFLSQAKFILPFRPYRIHQFMTISRINLRYLRIPDLWSLSCQVLLKQISAEVSWLKGDLIEPFIKIVIILQKYLIKKIPNTKKSRNTVDSLDQTNKF